MIKLRLLLEQTATHYDSIQAFKRDWKAMGNTIKVSTKYSGPDELNNGGDVDGSLLGIMIELFTEYGKPGVEITGGNDEAHIGMTAGKNIHETGNAIDLIPPNKGVDRDLDTILEKYKNKYPGFNYINEFTHPSGYSTGGHYHLQYRGAKLLAAADKATLDKALKPKPLQDIPTMPADATRVDMPKKSMPNLRKLKP
jgi:hypothetical protein